MWKRWVGLALLVGVIAVCWMYGVRAQSRSEQTKQDVCREALNTYDLAIEGANHAISEDDRQKMLKVAADERQRVDACMAEK